MSPIHINPAHKGMLHRAMGVPEGKKLSLADVLRTKARAKQSGDSRLIKQATFAANARDWNK